MWLTGAVLSQEEGGLECVVAYDSSALSKQEHKCVTTKNSIFSELGGAVGLLFIQASYTATPLTVIFA